MNEIRSLTRARSGAVGSALRSGRRGRVFESRLLDKRDIRLGIPFCRIVTLAAPEFRTSQPFVDIPDPVGGDDEGEEDDRPSWPFALQHALESFRSAPAVHEQPSRCDEKEDDHQYRKRIDHQRLDELPVQKRNEHACTAAARARITGDCLERATNR